MIFISFNKDFNKSSCLLFSGIIKSFSMFYLIKNSSFGLQYKVL
ncbi:hypothetical protein EZBTHKR_0708 [Elizabethkingia anophelis]|nr:hypothetical protein EZBTHKR_0708 [Elizabethkingia anophelis]